jgi:hypothetical protein
MVATSIALRQKLLISASGTTQHYHPLAMKRPTVDLLCSRLPTRYTLHGRRFTIMRSRTPPKMDTHYPSIRRLRIDPASNSPVSAMVNRRIHTSSQPRRESGRTELVIRRGARCGLRAGSRTTAHGCCAWAKHNTTTLGAKVRDGLSSGRGHGVSLAGVLE